MVILVAVGVMNIAAMIGLAAVVLMGWPAEPRPDRGEIRHMRAQGAAPG